MIQVYRIVQWCCHCHPHLIFIIFTNSFDSISVHNMMMMLPLMIKTCVTRFMLIHINTLCNRASLSCEFAEFLDSIHFMKQPKSTTELSNHMSKKTPCTNISDKCLCRLFCRVGGSRKAVGDSSILCWIWHGKRLPSQMGLYCGKS